MDEVFEGRNCEVCGKQATWKSGITPEIFEEGEKKSRWLCEEHRPLWYAYVSIPENKDKAWSFEGRKREFIRSKWQELFDDFISIAKGEKPVPKNMPATKTPRRPGGRFA